MALELVDRPVTDGNGTQTIMTYQLSRYCTVNVMKCWPQCNLLISLRPSNPATRQPRLIPFAGVGALVPLISGLR